MNISITARRGKASDRLKKYIMDRLERRERIFAGVIDLEFVLSYEKLTQVAEIKMKVSNKTIIIREKSDDIYKSVDQALDNCERQLKRFKNKQREHKNEKINDKIAV